MDCSFAQAFLIMHIIVITIIIICFIYCFNSAYLKIAELDYERVLSLITFTTKAYKIQYNFNGSNTDGSFITAISKSFLNH